MFVLSSWLHSSPNVGYPGSVLVVGITCDRYVRVPQHSFFLVEPRDGATRVHQSSAFRNVQPEARGRNVTAFAAAQVYMIPQDMYGGICYILGEILGGLYS